MSSFRRHDLAQAERTTQHHLGPDTRRTCRPVSRQLQSLQGNLDNSEVLRAGRRRRPAEAPIRSYVSEVVRCTVPCRAAGEIYWARLRARPADGALVDALVAPPGPPNHWSQCWVELQLGVAYAAANKIPQAASELHKVAAGRRQYEHPLTCVAPAGTRQARRSSKASTTPRSSSWHEATISAAYFDRYDVMEEAFRSARCAHLAAAKGRLSAAGCRLRPATRRCACCKRRC